MTNTSINSVLVERESDIVDISTYFAPAGRKTGMDLDEDISRATTNEFINGLMTIANGLFAVLNDKRQVIALNDSFIRLLGIEDTGQILGLIPSCNQ